MKKTAEEEQAVKTSEEEKSEESSEPADTREAVEMFVAEQAKKSSAETEETKTETEEKAAEEEEVKEEEKPEEEAPPETTIFILDKKTGKEIPFVVKADGKLHAPDSIEKGLQWTGLGVHANTKTAEINKEREEFNKAKPFLEMIQKAHDDGRLVIDGKPTKVVEGKPEEKEAEEEEFVDPELKVRDDKIAALEKKEVARGEEEIKTFITGAKEKIEKEIAGSSAKFPGAINRSVENAPKEVWDLLALKNTDGSLKFKNIEDAMKVSHDSMIAHAKKLIKSHPKEFDIDEDKIYAKKLKEKQEKEEAHVGAPSTIPTGEEPKSEEIEPKDPAEAMEMFTKQHKAKIAAAEKL